MFPVFGAPSPSGPRYYCHQCSREVDTYEENEERVCVNCRETFVEELESPVQPPPINPAPSFTSNQNPNPFFPFFQFPSGPGQAPVNGGSNGDQPAFSRIPLLNLSINMDLQSNENRPPFPQILQSLLQSMGANQNGAPPGLFNIFQQFQQGNDENMESLLNRLFEQHINPGPPPADEDAVQQLPRRMVTQEEENNQVDCSVCKDEYKAEEEVIELPCKHLYHPDCVLPWLKVRNTCPTCRYALPEKKKEQKKETPESQETVHEPADYQNDDGPNHETDHLYM